MSSNISERHNYHIFWIYGKFYEKKEKQPKWHGKVDYPQVACLSSEVQPVCNNVSTAGGSSSALGLPVLQFWSGVSVGKFRLDLFPAI